MPLPRTKYPEQHLNKRFSIFISLRAVSKWLLMMHRSILGGRTRKSVRTNRIKIFASTRAQIHQSFQVPVSHAHEYASSNELNLFLKYWPMGVHKLSPSSDLAVWTRPHDVSVFENIRFRVSTRISPFGGFKIKIHTGEQLKKRRGFGQRIHWIRVDGRLVRIKIYVVSKIAGFVWTGS